MHYLLIIGLSQDLLVHGLPFLLYLPVLAAFPTLPANDLIGVQAAGQMALGLLVVALTKGKLGIPTLVLS